MAALKPERTSKLRGEASSMPKQKKESASLKGWQQIATFLGQPTSVAQRWAKSGMPVTHVGRRVQASPEELNLSLTKILPGAAAGTLAKGTMNLKRGLCHVFEAARRIQRCASERV